MTPTHPAPSAPPFRSSPSDTPPRPALEINLSGLRCPLPVLRTKKALSEIQPGEILRVFATDADAQKDIPAFVKMAGHALLHHEAVPDGFVFLIRKK